MTSYSEFEKFLDTLVTKPKLLLHSCCGPCSTSVLELLKKYFDIEVYYYNPCIYPKDEFVKRYNEQKKLLSNFDDISLTMGEYEDDLFYKTVKGLEHLKEGEARCYKCIYMRMEKTCIYAKENGFDYFTTTLSVSPHKNSKIINKIGYLLEEKYNVKYLYSDFKKKDGFKRSILLSKKYDLYRQDYCGCKFSKTFE